MAARSERDKVHGCMKLEVVACSLGERVHLKLKETHALPFLTFLLSPLSLSFILFLPTINFNFLINNHKLLQYLRLIFIRGVEATHYFYFLINHLSSFLKHDYKLRRSKLYLYDSKKVKPIPTH